MITSHSTVDGILVTVIPCASYGLCYTTTQILMVGFLTLKSNFIVYKILS